MYESRLSLTIDSRTGERRVKSLRGELTSLDRAGDRTTGTMGRTSRQIDTLGTVSRGAGAAIAALAGTLGAREIIGYSDAWTNATNRIRTYTESAEQLAMVQSELVRTALDTRSNFEATADLYATFARSNDELGLSQEKIIELTGTINKSFALSGVEAAAAAGAIRQLGQGLASGALRGDEFNSVAEQAPDIMRAIADSLGMATGDLREFAATGGITSEIIVRALSEARDEIDGNFSRSMATFSQDLENARTNITRFVGESETISAATSGLGSAISGLTENIDALADAGVVMAGVFGVAAVSALGRNAAATVRNQMASVSLAAATAQKSATEVSWLRSVQASLSAQLASATSTTQMIALRRQLSANTVALTAANSTYTSSIAASTVAARAGTTALAGLRGAMAFLGGPVGVALIAAGSLYYFRDSLFDTRSEATETEKSIEGLTERMQGLTRAQLEHERTNLARQMRENATALSAAREEWERLQEAQSNSAAGSISGIGSVSLLADMGEAGSRMGQLSREGEALEQALSEVDQQMADLGATTARTKRQLESEEMDKLTRSIEKIRDQVDPLGAEFATLNTQISTLMRASALGIINPEERDRLIKGLVESMAEAGEDGGEEAGKNFSRGFESQVDRVADSLQNSITSGDWAGIGATIGASLASGVAQVVGDQVSGSLGAGIASAIGGPIVGAIAGGVVGLAAQKIADFFSDDWDPTEMRQAAQGTGTVLADMNAKSESIRRAVEGSESGIGQLVGINQNMLRALQNLQAGISGASTRIARGAGGQEFAAPGFQSGQDFVSELASLNFAAGPILGEIAKPVFQFFDEAASLFTFGLFDLGGLLGGKSRQVDEGVNILGGQLSDLIDETLVEAYATFRVKKNAFSSTKTKEKSRLLGDEVSNQFSLVFESIFDSVLSGADAIGVNASRALGNLEIETRRISLEDLSSEEQKAEFEAVFSEIFDEAAGAAVPFIDEFQRAGEGLGETLARVANQTLVTEEAVTRLGIQFTDLSGRQLVVASERLMEAAGGVEQFISSMEGFIDNFASDAQQFALAQSDITRALSQSNLQLPATRDGYYDLLQAQNGATAAGADNIATLLRLQGVADEYYTFLEDANRSAIESQRDLLSVQQSTYRDALQEAEAMAGSVSRALDGLSLTGQQFDAASRERALASLDRMATTGQIGSQSALDDALASATNINAGEFGTLNDYIRTVARTGATLTNLQQVTDRQVTREQKLLANIERRLEAMTEQLSAVGQQGNKNTARTASVLAQFNLDGIKVRE